MANSLKVFLSYSRADSLFAEKFAKDLRAAGLNVWVDQAEITPGEDFIAAINRGLTGAQWLVAVLTPDALESTFVRREVNAALLLLDRGKMAGVVPVLAKPCDPDTIPPLWGTLQRVDATQDYDHAVIELLLAFASTLPLPYAGELLSHTSAAHKQDDSVQQRQLSDSVTIPLMPWTVVMRPTELLAPTERDVSIALVESSVLPRREPSTGYVTSPAPKEKKGRGEYARATNRSAKVLALANQKGRVGKTITAINLAACLADAGRNTLLVDMSPNAEATSGLGVDEQHVGLSMFELLLDDRVTARSVMMGGIRPNLSLLPAKANLYAAESQLAYFQEGRAALRLKRALDALKPEFDFVLIDCPSWLGLLNINALSAADGVVLPLQCEYFALEGMQHLLITIRLVRDQFNRQIMLFGVVLTMFDPRSKVGMEVVREVSEHFPTEKFRTLIPHNVRLAEESMNGQTILEYEPHSPGALAYKELAEEVIERAATMWVANAGEPVASERTVPTV